MKMLRKLETPTCPLNPKPKILSAKGTPHWVRPQLVAQVRYTEITDDGRLRHPAYLGLRDDKDAAEVTVPRVPRVPAGSKGNVLKAVPRTPSVSSSDIDAIVEQLDFLEKARKNGRIKLPGGDTLEVTNLHKIFWPKIKKTKGDLIRFYAKISPFILPVIDNRPLVMKRLPNGVEGPSFYQHRAPEPVPPGVRIETLPNDDVPARLIGGSLKTLLYMAQLASISMDPWFSTMDDLDSADQVAIDLDPQPGATFSQILDCAEWVEEELDRVKIDGLPEDLRLGRPARLHPAAARNAIRGRHAVLPDHRDDGRGETSEGRDRRADGAAAQGRNRSTSITCRTSRARRSPAPTARAAARSRASRRR